MNTIFQFIYVHIINRLSINKRLKYLTYENLTKFVQILQQGWNSFGEPLGAFFKTPAEPGVDWNPSFYK